MSAPVLILAMLVLSVMSTICLGLYGLRSVGRVPAALPYALIMFSSAAWAILYTLYLTAPDLSHMVLYQLAWFVVLPFAPVLLLWLVVTYVKKTEWLRKDWAAVLLVIPAVSVAVAITSPWHTFFRYNFSVNAAGPVPVLSYATGPFFLLYNAYSFLLFLLALLILVTESRKLRTLREAQTLLLLMALVIPISINYLFSIGITPVPGVNLTPVTLWLPSVLYTIALFRYRFLDIVPIARSRLIEGMDIPMLVLDPGGRVMDLNPAACSLFGTVPETATGMGIDELVPDWPEFLGLCREIRTYRCDLQRVTDRGERFYTGSVEQFRTPSGEPEGKLVLLQDITELKEAEHSLRESEERLGLSLSVSQMGTWDLNLTDHTSWRSLRHDQIFGYETPLPAWTYEMFIDHVLPEDRAHVNQRFNEAVSDRKDWEFECRIRRTDGETRWIWARGRIQSGERGEAIRMLGLVQDITERKRVEEELAAAQQQYREIFDNVSIGILRSTPGPQGALIEANPAALRIFEADSREQLLAVRPSDLYLDPEQRRKISEEILATGIIREMDVRYKSLKGRAIWGRISAIRKVSQDGRIYFDTTIEDITGRKEAEDALRESEEKFRHVVENAPDAIFIQTEGMFAYVNPAACRIFGAGEPGQLIGRQVIDRFSPVFREIIKDRIRRLNEDRQPVGRIHETILRFDGAPVDVEVSAVPVIYTSKQGALVFMADITGRKQAEEKQERLVRELAQKNAELDRFTYTVSHDLKSPLISIRAFLSLLEDDLKSGNSARIQGDISHITESAEKLEHLITTLLALSRSGRTVDTPVRIPFSDLARESAGLLDQTLRERGIALTIPDTMPVICGDRQRLLQVMTNLIDNAVKFIGDQKEPRIEIGVRDDAGSRVFFVRDNGAGIEKENLSKVFGLFERFTPGVPGTGIGLATVKRIIEAHGGRIWAESEGPGKGTTICFTLPDSGKTDTDKDNSG